MQPLLMTSIASLALVVLKLVAFLMTGSMVMVASLVDSIGDSILSFINHRISGIAKSRADSGHPFGHGGFEVASSLVQGLVITGSGAVIIIHSLVRMVQYNHDSLNLDNFPFALGTLILSALSGYAIHRYIAFYRAKLSNSNQRSLALDADQAHYLSDFFVNATAALGLIGVYFFESVTLDAVCGLIGGVLILKSGIPVLRKCIGDILHTGISPEKQQSLVNIVMATNEAIQGVHRLRSRHLGPTTFVDFHLKLPALMTLEDAHAIGEAVQLSLRSQFPDIDLSIHLDPDNEPDDDLFDPVYQT